MSVLGKSWGRVWGRVWGSVSASVTSTYNPALELYEVTQGTVVLYWLEPGSASSTYEVYVNDVLFATQSTLNIQIDGLLVDTDYRFKVQADTIPVSTSRTILYSYASRNADTVTQMDRLKPFPTTQLP